MNNKLPVIIEDRQMPIDKYREVKNNNGFSDVIFISSMVATSVMWLIIIYICR